MFFLSGILSPWPDLKEQAPLALVVGCLQGLGSAVQKEPKDPVSGSPYQLYQGCVEFLQANYKVRQIQLAFVVSVDLFSIFFMPFSYNRV